MYGRKATAEVLFLAGREFRVVSREDPPNQAGRNVVEFRKLPLSIEGRKKLHGAHIEQLGARRKQLALEGKTPHHGPLRAQNSSYLIFAGKGERSLQRHLRLFACGVSQVAAKDVAVLGR